MVKPPCIIFSPRFFAMLWGRGGLGLGLREKERERRGKEKEKERKWGRGNGFFVTKNSFRGHVYM